MNTLDRQYLDLLQDILDTGVRKRTRNGEVLSVFGRQIRHSMKDGFPLLTTKKMAWGSIKTELLWFLKGRTDLRWLLANGNSIWVGDAYRRFKNSFAVNLQDTVCSLQEFVELIKTNDKFAQKWGDLGPIYGHQWRNYNGKSSFNNITEESKTLKTGIDQIRNVIDQLINDPDSRRIMVSAWNPEQINEMVLPPCHYGFQLYTRELTSDDVVTGAGFFPTRAISLMWNQRSVDVPLGLPFNIASYGLLLTMIADEVGMVPDQLIGNLGDTHIYLNQIDGVNDQLTRKSHPLPQVKVRDGIYSFGDKDILLENYVSEPPIKFPLSS